MTLLDWFSRSRPLRRQRRGGHPPARHRPRLTLESLEERTLLNYSITDLGTFGGTVSYAYAINNRGQVVGGADIACGCAAYPFLWYAGMLRNLGALGGATSNWAYGINDLGQVVGRTSHPFLWSRAWGMTDLGFAGDAYKVNNRTEIVGQMTVPPHAFLWRDGSVRDLGTLTGDGTSSAYGLNNQGWVVGQSGARAFLWTEQTGMKNLGTFDGDSGNSGASAINDLGQIVGESSSSAFGTHAAYFTRHGVIDLGTLGGVSEASAINNLGQVVGDAFTSGGDHAFVTDLAGGPMVDLNTLIPPDSGWTLFSARGINDAGQIVGTGQLPGYDIIHAYLLTPEDSPVVALVPIALEAGEVRALATDSPVLFPGAQANAPLGATGLDSPAPLLQEQEGAIGKTDLTAAAANPVTLLPAPSTTDALLAAPGLELTGGLAGWENGLAAAPLG